MARGKPRAQVEAFDPDRVRPLPDQPRKRFRGIRELADSIRATGQATPGKVTRIEGDPHYDVQLVDGERRLRACTLLGVEFEAVVEAEAAAGAERTFERSFAANFGKQDHDVIEISDALHRMHRAGRDLPYLAALAGKSRGWVEQHLNLQKLHPEVRALMVVPEEAEEDDTPKLTLALAQLLIPIPHEQQIKLARRVTARGKQKLSLPQARQFVLKERAASGDDTAYATRKSQTLSALETMSRDAKARLGVFFDMPGEKLYGMIRAMDNPAKRSLVEGLREFASDLELMAQMIDEQAIKGRRAG